MPVKYARDYPANWFTEIRPRILARAEQCCEECGVPNRARLWRKPWPDRRFHGFIPATADSPAVVVGAEHATTFRHYAAAGVKRKRVKLAIAHLDHDTTRNTDDNLRALCQWCHLRHDRRDNWRRRLYGRAVATGQLLEFDFSKPLDESCFPPSPPVFPPLLNEKACLHLLPTT